MTELIDARLIAALGIYTAFATAALVTLKVIGFGRKSEAPWWLEPQG